jgi:hypothetical protein
VWNPLRLLGGAQVLLAAVRAVERHRPRTHVGSSLTVVACVRRLAAVNGELASPLT